ncbi:helix-turn-helix transcriptional regulator [Clostridium sp. JN-1]|uniref:helix-turn-helix transcriptional regulator n=1 Tax=Clostridium sp. JN-1 TaxID=2483110 RepID=UPI0016818ABF|nr:helix-turn-helix transcriptional regulator [Clostridium sp. JN-1]
MENSKKYTNKKYTSNERSDNTEDNENDPIKNDRLDDAENKQGINQNNSDTDNSIHDDKVSNRKNLSPDIGTKLADARANAGYTQASAAEKVGVTRLTMCKYENNKSQPTFKKIQEMCDLYSISMEQLFSNNDNSKDTKEKDNTYLNENLNNALLDQLIDKFIAGLTYEGVLAENSVTDEMKFRLRSLAIRYFKKIQKTKK